MKTTWKKICPILLLGLAACTNPSTPAGYVGYVTKHPMTTPVHFYGLQTGPTSTGLGWCLEANNIFVAPITSTEAFEGQTGVLAKDNLHVEFQAHLIWKVDPDNVRMFVEKYGAIGDSPDAAAYNSFVKEPFRTYTRDEVQKYNGLDIKDNITTIGTNVQNRVMALTKGTPFIVISVVIGNIQYPQTVADSVAQKLAATQVLQQTTIEIETAKAKAQIREADAEGIAKAMDVINQKLTPLYVQYEAIQAQGKMVNSPNHTEIYIPVGPNGVPIVTTIK
ncbi:MAG TPA: SPFH domain-containing protein [Nitrosopumilaceae archaeon]|jgi:regulator of protease activity HflC (stomatin/prohibitin superfamily)|nr:SPFH domain-containing protein [Nitrosopumilaceae archaeon]